MINLFIDNKGIELPDNLELKIGFSMQDLYDINPKKTSLPKKINAPISAKNRMTLGYTEQILSPKIFNQTIHKARIEVDGVILVSGKAHLLACEFNDNGEGEYIFEVRDDAQAWIINANNSLMRELPLNFDATITSNLVKNSWVDTSAVKFLPVFRDRYDEPEFETEVPSVRTLSYDDYHPFVNVKKAMDAIVGESGYSINSSFLNSDFFKSLYISGHYPSKNVALLKAKMNFFAGRFKESSATANTFGVVYASPYESLSSVGNLFDTANTYESLDGYRVEGAFNNGGCFKKVDARTAFIANDDLSLSFEYRIRYKTNYKVASIDSLKGFDKIILHDGSIRNINISNTLIDYKNQNGINGSFTSAIFCPMSNATFQLKYYIEGDSTAKYIDVSTVEKQFTFANNIRNVTMEMKISAVYIPVPDNQWAFYKTQDFTEATKNVEVDLIVRSNPSSVTKNQRVFFDTVRFSGADQGTSITILRDTSLRPVFFVNPMEGSRVTIAELFAHEKSQLELFNGIKHMFRLYFYTDELTKTIYIEPYTSFLGNNIIDWSQKTDTAKHISVEDFGADMARTINMLYQDEDGSAMRWNEENKKKYAQWQTSITNVFAQQTEVNDRNPLFSPSINITRSYPQARSASMLQVGNRVRYGDNYDDGDLNFAPKIVRYLGMKTLPVYESWGWPSYANSYPLVAFHHTVANENFSLCYDNFENQIGLNSYHTEYFNTTNKGKKITANIYLNAADIELLLHPSSSKNDLRALFKIKICGEDMLCRLFKIVDFDPNSCDSTKCIFIKE